MKQQEKIKIEIAKIEEKSNHFYAESEKSLQNEIDYNTLILQGRFEEAEHLKIINELKEKGIKIDDKKIAKMEQQKKQLSEISTMQGLRK